MVAIDANFCPTCGAELGTVALEDRDRLWCPDCEEVVWRTPVPTAGVVVREGNRALVAERGPPREGQWTVPGGFLEYDESAPEAAARELREETSVRVEPGDLRLLATHHHHWTDGVHTLLIRYVVDRELTAGEPEAGSDVQRAEFRTFEEFAAEDVHPANRRFVRLALERAEPDR